MRLQLSKIFNTSSYYSKFRLFDENDAVEWAHTNYGEISVPEAIRRVIADYCYENEPEINKCLRGNNNLTENDKIKLGILDNFLNSYTLDEDIVVYRMMNFHPFKQHITYSKNFIEPGFMSTSLVNGAINHIHKYDYRLKIFLPKGTKGFYVDFISNRVGEYEYLLPRDTKINFLKELITKDQRRVIREIHCCKI